ncbi:2Fe-2S iron-sulfur cluster-binding protein [Halosolutus amylolyticus]|uniref:2Fe-2S iron-sulfur cluster-binding protein n=1 Tax=Halosolutus amylolyticus TaxID=2932267 RepID=A0ABD5PKK5_9EURY|nr:2Fe-2S iron-sulfur cluster-binding protein [Halosolutus amylolyticus]
MTSHDVTLEWPDGRSDTVTVEPRETVLEAALREGIRLPYDCREGTCTTCVGRLLAVDGDDSAAGGGGGSDADDAKSSDRRSIDAATAFDYRRPPAALTEREHADGYVLLCIALAQADCRVAVGPRIRAEIGDSPWG